jgi:hypothetical protein
LKKKDNYINILTISGIVHKEKKKFDVSLHPPPQPPEDHNVEPRASSSNGNPVLDPNNDTTGTTVGSERGK